MDLPEYRTCVEALPFGKRVHTAVYLYREAGTKAGEPLDSLLAGIVKRCEIGPEFNVLKFRTDELKVSFLSYPDFLSDAHPALRQAVTVDLVTGRARRSDYAGNLNPPILHRKETFLSADHPLRRKFQALTAAEEAAGLYEDTTTIGFRLNWEKLLKSKGLAIRRHSLQQAGDRAGQTEQPETVIERHRTALTRYELSKPVKGLLQHGLLKPGFSVFDYRCGQAADVRGLQALGYTAEGWDPVYRRETPKQPADVVNLGYVLNVIEEPAERLEALVDAYRYAKRLLVVSGLIRKTAESRFPAPNPAGTMAGFAPLATPDPASGMAGLDSPTAGWFDLRLKAKMTLSHIF